MRPRLGLESTRGIAASSEPVERAAPAPIAATCLSSVLRETLAGAGPLLGSEETCGADLLSLRSAIKTSISSCAKKLPNGAGPTPGGQKPCVESSSKGGSFSPKNDGHVRPAQTFMLTISDPSLAGLRSNVLDNHRSGCFLSAN